jgi:glycosyltransferase involved in cell wall biosynthesis
VTEMLTTATKAKASLASLSTKTPAVIIVGPPWPRSGTARVIQNQIEYYRDRGYLTVFICVPIHCSYTEDYPDWSDIKAGMQELGADHIFFAPIDNRRFVVGKYTGWVRHLFAGTALDWIVTTAMSAQLPEDAVQFIGELSVALLDVNHVFTLGFARRLLRRVVHSHERIPIVLETHDVQSHLLEERHEINPWIHRADDSDRLLESELSLLKKAKVLVHCSVDDFNFFKARLPGMSQILALPSIDETFVSQVEAVAPASDPIDLLFVGQSTNPNCAAMKWFFEDVWPIIADRGYRVKIVGQVSMLVRKNLPEIYEAFESLFVGQLADLAPTYRAARCVFAPMVSGTGISIKTIEALALGKPFVGTSMAYRGMPMERIAKFGLQAQDTPQAFADAIVKALSNERTAASASRAAYEDLFSPKASFSSRDEILRIATTP